MARGGGGWEGRNSLLEGQKNRSPTGKFFSTADLPKPIFGAEAAKMTLNLKYFPFYPPQDWENCPPKVFFGLPALLLQPTAIYGERDP